MPTNGPTVRDVARHAGVSVASVSRALNGIKTVRPDVRKLVEDAARELGYVPHAGARNLSLQRSGAVGVALPDLHGEYFSELVRGLHQAALDHGTQLLLSNVPQDPERAVEALNHLRGRVDALVILAPHLDPDCLLRNLSPNLPTVLLNGAPHKRNVHELRLDNYAGAQAMVQHLHDRGCYDLVHIAGPAGNIEAQERQRGFLESCAELGINGRILAGDFSEEAGAAAASEIIASRLTTDGIFAANDMMAIGAMTVLKSHGIALPDDMALAGFDDIPLARLVTPALTTIRVDIAGMGKRAMAVLFQDDPKDRVNTPILEWKIPELIARETTTRVNPRTDPSAAAHNNP
ncbi:LacI family DNA-binding transcriptional regulator [Altererythrobacter indicus]|uniref:LacI family DNA-binding transcriptional regulator n=1 Tax=Altericroceibacterium indicum TaxID=374177 RepID=A0A845A9Q4_9SPHN|nr:LacI family DNA-binding transcriptional regulator [Altericroceibacterium indicum]MXP25525.1 LacI family DNA-binding transcriptional regulator [Altericroceibacterium indicum]